MKIQHANLLDSVNSLAFKHQVEEFCLPYFPDDKLLQSISGEKNIHMWQVIEGIATIPPRGLATPGTLKLYSKGHTGSKDSQGQETAQ